MGIIRCTSGEAAPANLAEEGYAAPGAFTGNTVMAVHGACIDWVQLAFREAKSIVGSSGGTGFTIYRTYGIHQFLINDKALRKPVDMFGNPGQDIVTPLTVNLEEADLPEGVCKLGKGLTFLNTIFTVNFQKWN